MESALRWSPMSRRRRKRQAYARADVDDSDADSRTGVATPVGTAVGLRRRKFCPRVAAGFSAFSLALVAAGIGWSMLVGVSGAGRRDKSHNGRQEIRKMVSPVSHDAVSATALSAWP